MSYKKNGSASQDRREPKDTLSFLVRGVSIPYTEPPETACALAERKLCKVLGRGQTPVIVSSRLYKQSVDARKKPEIRFVCTVLIEARCRKQTVLAALEKQGDVALFEEAPFSVSHGEEPMEGRPVIVGFGPAGMFCAMVLAENGMRPIILERGEDVEKRGQTVAHFHRTGELNLSSNIQFGAGGAGTFSDGKLMTRIGDPCCSYILRRFVQFGASADILIKAKPHVGTDVLTTVVSNIRDYLLSLGCEIRFETQMTGIRYTTDAGGRRRAFAVETTAGEIPCGALILAIGHSARDTYETLYRDGLTMAAKPFSVGVRIEHLQKDMNVSAYGAAAKDTAACGASRVLLPPAEYAVSYKERPGADGVEGRGVYSFCMCPGGEVMAAASEAGGVVVNGMSRSARNGRNANAALAVSVRTSDYGGTPMEAIAYQRMLEQAAFSAGGGGYYAPIQTVGDFLSGHAGTQPTRVLPSYRDGKVRCADLHTVLPSFVTELLATGIRYFDRQLPGFASPEAVLTGVETRTSAPVRLMRGDLFLAEHTDNIYPIGEGAGYAGGITSAAADGLHAAQQILARYRV